MQSGEVKWRNELLYCKSGGMFKKKRKKVVELFHHVMALLYSGTVCGMWDPILRGDRILLPDHRHSTAGTQHLPLVSYLSSSSTGRQ